MVRGKKFWLLLRQTWGFWLRERASLKQGFIALGICSLGGLVAGIALGAMVKRLELLPGLIILVPAAIGMRGNIFGALGSRLGTLLHTGIFRLSRDRQELSYQNAHASLHLTLATALYLGIMAKIVAISFGVKGISLLDFLLISVLGGIISGIVVFFFTLFLAMLCYRKQWDMDNISAPLITVAGDAVTIPSLYVASFLVEISWVTPMLSLLMALIALWGIASGIQSDLSVSRRIFRESLPVLALAGLIDLFAGTTLEHQLQSFISFPALLVILPSFLEAVGALGSILAARLASKLHLGIISPQSFPSLPAFMEFTMILLFAASVFFILGVSAHFVGYIVGLKSPGIGHLLLISLLAGYLSTFVALFVAYYAAIASFRYGLDPDNHGIPIVTSTMDFLGVISLVLTMILLGVA
jgi:mgtE-like transporter